MIIEKVYFKATDDVQLFGLLHKNEEIKSNKVVLSVHGMTSNCMKKREDIFANSCNKNGIDYFCFDNRGANIIEYFKRIKDGKVLSRIEAGTAKENFEDCYYDIKGAILALLERGYKEIYLQGHSYGSAKVVYTYNKMKNNMEIDILRYIKQVILLSIIDIPRMCRSMLGDKYNYIISEIKQMVNENRGEEMIRREYFLHPITANNFLFINKINGTVDVAPFGDENTELIALNNIECPLMMIWGKDRDMIEQTPDKLVEIIKAKIKNPNLEVDFIEGTGHNYKTKEVETIDRILKTILKM